MATTLDQVADLFTNLISDYKITALFQSSGSGALNTYLEPWLMFAIDDFDGICDQALVYDSGSQVFSVTLTQKNKNVLARIMTRYWMEKEVNDVLQMSNFVTDRDFKTFSAAQNIMAKQEMLNAKKEEVSQLLANYGLKYAVTWDNWEDQNFD